MYVNVDNLTAYYCSTNGLFNGFQFEYTKKKTTLLIHTINKLSTVNFKYSSSVFYGKDQVISRTKFL